MCGQADCTTHAQMAGGADGRILYCPLWCPGMWRTVLDWDITRPHTCTSLQRPLRSPPASRDEWRHAADPHGGKTLTFVTGDTTTEHYLGPKIIAVAEN